jgi:hypothetical protein
MIEIVSLLSILIAIIIGIVKNINVGFIALVFAFFLGTLLGGLSPNTIIGFWPLNLFFTTVGVTLFFSIAKINGTLKICQQRSFIAATAVKSKFKSSSLCWPWDLHPSDPGIFRPPPCFAHWPCHRLSIQHVLTDDERFDHSRLYRRRFVTHCSQWHRGFGTCPHKQCRRTRIIHLYAEYDQHHHLFTLFFLAMKGYKMNGQKTEVSPPSPFTYEQKLTLLSILILIIWVIFGKVHVGFAGFTLAVALFFLQSRQTTASHPTSAMDNHSANLRSRGFDRCRR